MDDGINDRVQVCDLLEDPVGRSGPFAFLALYFQNILRQQSALSRPFLLEQHHVWLSDSESRYPFFLFKHTSVQVLT